MNVQSFNLFNPNASFSCKYFFFLLIFIFYNNSDLFAQKKIDFSLFQLLEKNKDVIFSKQDVINPDRYLGMYSLQSAGLKMVYLQQHYKGIPVMDALKVLAFRGDSLVSIADNFVDKIQESVVNTTASIKPELAVSAALNSLSINVDREIKFTDKKDNAFLFGNLGVAYTDISCELMWLPVSRAALKLVWLVEVLPVTSSDHLLISVDAYDNKVLDKISLTVYEHIDSTKNDMYTGQNITNTINDSCTLLNFESVTSVDRHASYKVIPYPNESPSNWIQISSESNDPWLISNPADSIYSWHFDGSVFHDSTKGNNVWAQEDRDNNNSTYGRSALSSTSSPNYSFNVTPDLTQAPTSLSNQQFAITNLFYWNNLMHDIAYEYGFDEASGNFQFSNFNRIGLANDPVIADAQDAGGFNNANFTTPIDGFSPRMQIYLFNKSLPWKDADLDNGIIVHEYTHGISNRLTGGPMRSSCLSNAEQAGEGWSDYFALMMTTHWESATILDKNIPRTLGNYVLNQDLTGRGIRSYPYSADLNLDPLNYGMLSQVGGNVHKIGEIWCSALWDMTWNLIDIEGINQNIFNPDSIGGNSIALKLVMEGMRLQPCRPGLIDSRNAILKADSIFFDAKYSCAIWEAFAKRGMGKNALQGSSNSTTDQLPDFTADIGMNIRLTQNLNQQNASGLITYCNKVKASSCFDIVNYWLRDTLPLNVSYISGGTYDSITRVVSFMVNVSSGLSAEYYFTVKVNSNAYFEPISYFSDSVNSTSLNDKWIIDPPGNSNWFLSNEYSHSSLYALFCLNASTLSDQSIVIQQPLFLPASTFPHLIFSHWMQSEKNWDGGVVEISSDNGVTWSDAGSEFEEGYYNGVLNLSGNAISGRPAFTGNTEGLITTSIDLSSFSGTAVKFRFRFATDENYAGTGWFIDDVRLVDTAIVKMVSVMFDNSHQIHAKADCIAKILPPLSCDSIRIWKQPDTLSICESATDSISILATGTGLNFQWEISTDDGLHYDEIEGANLSTLSIINTDVENDNTLFRCIVRDNCGRSVISNVSLLKIISLTINEKRISRCGPGNVTIRIEANANETIDWYNSENALQPMSSSQELITPELNSTTTYWMKKRNLTQGCKSLQKALAIVSIDSIPSVPLGIDSSRCGSGSIALKAIIPIGCTPLWYDRMQGGIILDSDIVFRSPIITTTQQYYAASKSSKGCISSGRISVSAVVNSAPPAISTVSGTSRCAGESAVISATSPIGNIVCWFVDSSSSVPIQLANTSGVNNFQTPVLQETIRYWVANQNVSTGCFSAIKTPVRVYIYPRPVLPSITTFSRCGPGTIKMTLQSVPVNLLSYKWYSSAVSNMLLGTSNVYTTPYLSSGANYYVEAKNNVTGCVSENRATINAIINPIPNTPIAVDTSRCGKGNVMLRAIADVGIDWYAVASGGVPIAVNKDTFSCIELTTSKQYYAVAHNYNTGCTSLVRRRVTANVIPILSAPRTITGISNICPYVFNSSGLLYSVSPVSGAQRYVWSFPNTAIVDSGGDGIKVKLHYIGASLTDTIFVMADNGCNGLRKFMKLNTLACGTTKSKRENQYKSDTIIMLYPNPSRTYFKLKIDIEPFHPALLIIEDVLGRPIRKYSINESGEFVFGYDLFAGIYFVHVSQRNKSSNFKIEKL